MWVDTQGDAGQYLLMTSSEVCVTCVGAFSGRISLPSLESTVRTLRRRISEQLGANAPPLPNIGRRVGYQTRAKPVGSWLTQIALRSCLQIRLVHTVFCCVRLRFKTSDVTCRRQAVRSAEADSRWQEPAG